MFENSNSLVFKKAEKATEFLLCGNKKIAASTLRATKTYRLATLKITIKHLIRFTLFATEKQ